MDSFRFILTKVKFYLSLNTKTANFVAFSVLIAIYISVRNIILKRLRKRKKLAPGPIGLPILGSLLSLIKNERLFYDSLSLHGPLSLFYIGSRKVFMLNDPIIASKLLKNENCLSRPKIDPKFDGKYAKLPDSVIMLDNSSKWTYIRKIVHKNFMLLLNSEMLEENVNKTLKNTIFPVMNDCIKNNKLFYPHKYLMFMGFNNIFSICFGRNIDINSKEYSEYSSAIAKRTLAGGVKVLFGFLGVKSPLIGGLIDKFIDPYTWITYNYLNKWLLESTGYDIYPFLNKRFNQINNDTFNNSPHNICAKLFIKDCLNNENNNNLLTPFDVFLNIDNLFVAGTDTTSKSGEYIITLFGIEEKLQNIIYDEIINVINNNNLKQFSFNILHKLHYFRAFIWEGLRLSSVVKVGVPRSVTKDFMFKISSNKEYFIPKDSILMLNMKHCNVYNSIWSPNNENVNLNNWLDENNKFKMNQNFCGFSMGKRDCPGKSVALRTLYYAISNILINYKIKIPNKINKNKFKIKQTFDFVLRIDPTIGLRLIKRN